jgi:hypothetical protein
MPHEKIVPLRICAGFRWVARTAACGFVLLILAFLIGEGIDLRELSTAERIMAVALGVTVLGLATSWQHEIWGGVLILASMSTFYLTNHSQTASWPGGWVFPALFALGFVFLSIGLIRRITCGK